MKGVLKVGGVAAGYLGVLLALVAASVTEVAVLAYGGFVWIVPLVFQRP